MSNDAQNIDQLLEEAATISDEIAAKEELAINIRHQLDSAAAKAKSTGEYSNSQWFNNAKARYAKVRKAQAAAQRRLKDLRQRIAVHRQEVFTAAAMNAGVEIVNRTLAASISEAAIFSQVAKEKLAPEIFEELSEEAVSRAQLVRRLVMGGADDATGASLASYNIDEDYHQYPVGGPRHGACEHRDGVPENPRGEAAACPAGHAAAQPGAH